MQRSNWKSGGAVPRLALAVAEYRQRFGTVPSHAHGSGVMSIAEPPTEPHYSREYTEVRARAVNSRLKCRPDACWIRVSGPEGNCSYGLVHRDAPLVLTSYRWLYGEDPLWAWEFQSFKALHLIVKHKPDLPTIDLLPSEQNFYRSGNWKLANKTARALLGAKIYFHEKQVEPSFRGGTIVNFEVVPEGRYKGRIIFTFAEDSSCKGIVTPKKGWAQVLKIIRS